MAALRDVIASKQTRSLLGYGALLVGVAGAYLLIRAYGDTLAAPAPLDASLGAGKLAQVHVNDFVHVLLALAFVIASARALGAVFRLIQQPPVVGEMIAGILLGPSLLGHLAPAFAGYILPQSIAPLLNVISQFGVILYMFLVGLELDVSSLRDRATSTIAISHASIVAPFLLGAGLALPLYPYFSNSTVSFTAFSLFLGVSMSVTAFPVLARILTDRRIHKTKMGVLTLACAAVDDVTAWCLLAFVVSVTQSRAGSAFHTLLMAVVYIAAMLVVVRPLVVRLTAWIDGKGRVTQGALAFVLLGILWSSLATESIGIHSIFGAFVLGAIIPHGSSLARELAAKLEDFVIVFLLPAFFAFTGLRTQIGLVTGARQWMFCALIVLVASAGKFGGSAIAARLTGLGWRDASALGVLMNTRGLMELIVLNIGLELHVISPVMFAMLVIMALTTTLATSPILHFIMPRHQLEEEANQIEEESRLSLAINERSGTLIPVSSTTGVAGLLDIASSLMLAEGPPPRVLALNRGSATGVSSKIREAETFSPSRSPVLAAALDAAWAKGIAIKPEAVWTIDAATEIVDAAEEGNVRWVLLESRRSILGRYPKRSVVNKVMDLLESRPLNVAVLIPPSPLRKGPVTCIVHALDDGRPTLELATLLARSRRESIQLVILQSELDVMENLPAHATEWFNSLATAGTQPAIFVRDKKKLSGVVPSGLVVIAKDVVDECDIPIDGITVERSIIVVQGGGRPTSRSAVQPVELETLSPSVT